MSSPEFYFVNHTRQEYCYFDNSESIVLCIETAIHKYESWEITDDIRVESQLASDTDVIDYLTGEGFVNADHGPEDSEIRTDSNDDEMME